MLRILGSAVLVGAALGTLGIIVATRAWHSASEELRRGLREDVGPTHALDRSVLPPIVRTYLGRAVPADASDVVGVRLTQAGEFRLGEGDDGWKPFSAVQDVRVAAPGFIWDARIRLAPGIDVFVRDSYGDGVAGMVGRVGGIVPVVDMGHSDALASGTLSRYLAEAVWFPVRLGSGPGLSWDSKGERTASATLVADGSTVTVDFTFSPDGDPVEVHALRPREVDGGFVPTPWVGRFSDHRDVEGFRIPFRGEVAWIVDGVETTYWRGSITSLSMHRGP